jgi:hypothetical protein
MVERLMILAPTPEYDEARVRLQAAGGRLLAIYGATVWIVELPPEAEASLAQDPAVRGVFAGPVPEAEIVADEAGRSGIAAWNLRRSESFRAARAARPGEGLPWDEEGFEPEG